MSPTSAGTVVDQRGHILATALALMSERGAPDTSMRNLADACGLNVATLYHYFPSKTDLVHAVIEDRRYLDRLAEELPPIDASLPPRGRVEAILRYLWRATLAEDALVRLILGESIRHEPAAVDIVSMLIEAMDAGFEHWLTDLVPELDGDSTVVARIIRGQVIAWLIEGIIVTPKDRDRSFDRRAADLAAILVPG